MKMVTRYTHRFITYKRGAWKMKDLLTVIVLLVLFIGAIYFQYWRASTLAKATGMSLWKAWFVVGK